MASKVAVTGIGIVSPLGVGIKAAWANLLQKQTGIVQLPAEQYPDTLPSRVAGLVPHGSKDDGKWDPKEWVSGKDLRRTPLFAQYALAASKLALEDAQWFPETEEQFKYSGVAVGSGIGGIDAAYENSVAYHQGGFRKVSPMFVPNLLSNMAAGHVSIATGFRGPNHAVATACTTGAHALGDAANLIRLGSAKVMIAGSTEASIHPISLAGFGRAKALSSKRNDDPAAASRPFDTDRDGFVIGEGSAVVILEELEHAKARGARIYATLDGYGLSGDAHHITAPSPDGRGARDCMESALKQSGVNPLQVDYINAHATSTPLGDQIEASAIASIFGDRGQELQVSSTKGATGHLLGASGSLEAAFTVMAIHEQTAPPGLNIKEPIPGIPFSLTTEATKCEIRHAMTNSFGFGGTNASLLFSKV